MISKSVLTGMISAAAILGALSIFLALYIASGLWTHLLYQ